jgi:thiamine biosynthesis lipoprotein
MRRLGAALLLAALLLSACARAPQLHQREAYVFGTRVEVSVWGESADRAAQALAAVLAEFDRLHRMLHAWQPSELTALNGAIARGERAIAVSGELTFLLEDAADIAARSDHLFDPAIGRLVALWGFHTDEFKPLLPDAAAVEAAVQGAAAHERPGHRRKSACRARTRPCSSTSAATPRATPSTGPPPS